jgi:hypothetical protein
LPQNWRLCLEMVHLAHFTDRAYVCQLWDLALKEVRGWGLALYGWWLSASLERVHIHEEGGDRCVERMFVGRLACVAFRLVENHQVP